MIAPLRDRRTLRTLREQGRRGRSGPVTVRYAGPAADDDRCLVAYAIGRRAGSAVVRNRIRRRLRPLVHELATSGALPPGALLVSAASPVATAPHTEVRAHLRRAVDRAVAGPTER